VIVTPGAPHASCVGPCRADSGSNLARQSAVSVGPVLLSSRIVSRARELLLSLSDAATGFAWPWLSLVLAVVSAFLSRHLNRNSLRASPVVFS